jgi:polar amino acid transport system substrate-binding protein
MRVWHLHRFRPLALTCAVLLLLSSCADPSTGAQDQAATTGSTPAPAPSATTAKNSKLAALVPASVTADGVIVVASAPSYAPIEFYGPDNATLIGLHVDLGKALGRVLETRVEFTRAGFDSIIPGLQSGKFELGMSAFTDTAEREKTVDFVTYFSAGTSLMVVKGNPDSLRPDGESLCGKRVAVMKGSTQELDDIPSRNKSCGKPIEAKVFPDQNAVNLALASGRADAVLADSPVLDYAVQQGQAFEISGAPYGTAPYGIAVPKASGELAEALRGALEEMAKSGEYRQILDKWGVGSGAIDSFQVNAAGN